MGSEGADGIMIRQGKRKQLDGDNRDFVTKFQRQNILRRPILLFQHSYHADMEVETRSGFRCKYYVMQLLN